VRGRLRRPALSRLTLPYADVKTAICTGLAACH
jgi:hypothetical protein